MSRLDVNQLTVPAEFASIFDRQSASNAQAATEAVAEPPPSVPPPSASLLDALASNGVRVTASNSSCPKCSTVISAVETKMGRCLTCGTSFAGGTVQIGI
jgi:hypothetical protein